MQTTSATGSNGGSLSSGRARAAFTLVEVTIVVFIIAVITAVSIPALARGYRTAVFRQNVRDAVTACQLARLRAVVEQRPAMFHVDLDHQQLWVTQAGAPVAAELGTAETRDPAEAEPSEFAVGEVLKVIAIKSPSRILSAQRADEAVRREGQLAIVFQPNGTAEAVTILFGGGDREDLLAVQVDGITGRAVITEVRP